MLLQRMTWQYPIKDNGNTDKNKLVLCITRKQRSNYKITSRIFAQVSRLADGKWHYTAFVNPSMLLKKTPEVWRENPIEMHDIPIEFGIEPNRQYAMEAVNKVHTFYDIYGNPDFYKHFKEE